MMNNMNDMVMQGKWHQARGAMKEKWGRLTDDDMQMFLGEGEQLVGKLQERYGYNRAQAQHEVEEFMHSLRKDLSMAEASEKTVEVVREHPWYTGMFFGSIVLLVAVFMLNRMFQIVEIGQEEKTMENTRC